MQCWRDVRLTHQVHLDRDAGPQVDHLQLLRFQQLQLLDGRSKCLDALARLRAGGALDQVVMDLQEKRTLRLRLQGADPLPGTLSLPGLSKDFRQLLAKTQSIRQSPSYLPSLALRFRSAVPQDAALQ